MRSKGRCEFCARKLHPTRPLGGMMFDEALELVITKPTDDESAHRYVESIMLGVVEDYKPEDFRHPPTTYVEHRDVCDAARKASQ